MPSIRVKYLLLIPAISLCLVQCTPKLSGYFDSTSYVESFNTHIVNDSLELHLITAADIQFTKERDKLRDIMNERSLTNGLLAYGETVIAPHYNVYVWLNPPNEIRSDGVHEIVKDTLLQGQKIAVKCESEVNTESKSFVNDCKDIFKSIRLGENYRKDMASVFDISRRFSTSNKYYEALHEILDYPARGRNEKFIQLQLALNYASFMAPNDIYEQLIAEFQPPGNKDSVKQAINSHAITEMNEIERTLLEAAENHRIVMFNENHFFPNHRILLERLLPKLKEQGFKYLALEALGPSQDSLLNTGNSPTLDTGYYIREQHFADLIRTGRQLGFTFVGYENLNREKPRELGQAENLYRKTFLKDDSAKVVVLAGIDHILEQPTPTGKSWLGHILHKKYQFDPLTVSQSHLNRYRNLANPLALINSNRFQNPRLKSVDWLLLNNLELTDRNPNYTYTNTFKEKVQIAVFLESQISSKGDYARAIPYRTRLVDPKDKFMTELPDGQHYLVAFNKNGDLLKETRIEPRI